MEELDQNGNNFVAPAIGFCSDIKGVKTVIALSTEQVCQTKKK